MRLGAWLGQFRVGRLASSVVGLKAQQLAVRALWSLPCTQKRRRPEGRIEIARQHAEKAAGRSSGLQVTAAPCAFVPNRFWTSTTKSVDFPNWDPLNTSVVAEPMVERLHWLSPEQRK